MAMKPKADWIAVEGAFRSGNASIRDIAADHGITDGAIRARAKKLGWLRDPTGTKREMVKAKPERNNRIKAPTLFNLRQKGELPLHYLFNLYISECYEFQRLIDINSDYDVMYEYVMDGLGRADFVYMGDDDCIVVEVKKSGNLRDIQTGIGQLLSYRSWLQVRLKKRVKAVFAVQGEINPYILDCCDMTGLIYIPMPSEKRVEKWRRILGAES